MNQKKAVDVLSKWPPKDRGTSRNPRSLDNNGYRVCSIHGGKSQDGLKHSGPILMDTLRLGVERCRKVSDGFRTLSQEQREWAMNSFKEGRHAAKIYTSEDRDAKL